MMAKWIGIIIEKQYVVQLFTRLIRVIACIDIGMFYILYNCNAIVLIEREIFSCNYKFTIVIICLNNKNKYPISSYSMTITLILYTYVYYFQRDKGRTDVIQLNFRVYFK